VQRRKRVHDALSTEMALASGFMPVSFER